MNQNLGRTLFTIVVLVALLGCGRKSADPAAADADADEKVINVYSWLDYIAPDTIANFEKETGLKVHYDMYDNNEVLETKLFTGHTHYDVVLPTGPFFARQREADIYRPLDKAALPNLVNADPDIMQRMAEFDPGNRYAIPYMFTTTGLGYNVDQLHARLGATVPQGWALLFDPANAAKLKDCGIAIIDSEMDVFQSAMFYLGRDPNRLDPADVAAASDALMRIRPFIRYIDPAQYISDMANNSICLALGWSGDVEQARSRAEEAHTEAHLAYVVPREGGVITVDMMAIPKDAPHAANAHVWMNYLMRPDVMAHITNTIRYPNGYTGSLPLVAPDVKADPAIYPDAAMRARLVSPKPVPPEYSRLVTREWTRFRTGN